MKSTRLRIGFCENGAGYGGAVISLAAFLAKLPDEFEPFIYTESGADDYRRLGRFGYWRHLPRIGLLKDSWLRNRRLPLASTVDNICNIAPYAMRFYYTFKKDGIRIAYLNNDPGCNLAAALGAKLAGIPLVLHARGFSAGTRANLWVVSHLDYCIAVSNAVRIQLLELGVPPEKCSVVPEGLDMTTFAPRNPSACLRRELQLQEHEPVITMVGGLVDWKGQDIVLGAAPKVLAAFPNAHILLVGSAYGKDARFAEMIARQAAAPHLRGRVRLLGARTDIPEILSISSVVLHASTKPEPFGRTFLEGMAMGKPVIASNEGGPPEVIRHGIDGLLIEPRDPHILAAAIIRVLSDPSLARTLSQQAIQTANRYTIESHSQAISSILRRVD